jgi:hypothetical protein
MGTLGASFSYEALGDTAIRCRNLTHQGLLPILTMARDKKGIIFLFHFYSLLSSLKKILA